MVIVNTIFMGYVCYFSIKYSKFYLPFQNFVKLQRKDKIFRFNLSACS